MNIVFSPAIASLMWVYEFTSEIENGGCVGMSLYSIILEISTPEELGLPPDTSGYQHFGDLAVGAFLEIHGISRDTPKEMTWSNGFGHPS